MDLIPDPDISVMDRAKIQAQVILPIARALREELGRERAHAILRDAIGVAHRAQVRDESKHLEGTPREKFQTLMNRSAQVNGPQLDIEMHEPNSGMMRFDVRGCRYAELFKSLGEPEIGGMLLCDGDYYMAEVGAPDVTFTRTQTVMQGASHCDFCYRFAGDDQE